MAALLVALSANGLAAQQPKWSEWRHAMPFHHKGGAAEMGTTHGPEEELERMGLDGEGPDLKAVYSGGKGGADVRWERFRLNAAPTGWFDTGVMNFRGELETARVDSACAYLVRSVECAQDMDLAVTMGSDDSLRVWLNGEVVHEFLEGRGVNVRDDEVSLPLKAGVNHLMVKVVQTGSGWGFGARTVEYLDTGDRGAAQEDINAAIDGGVEWLIGAQLRDGSWPFEQHRFRNGQTALVLYALLKSGVSATHPSIQRGFAFLSGRMPSMTYSAGCELLALASLPGDAHLARMEEIVELLDDWEQTGFGYPGGAEDLSNTQYAALGYFAAASKGIEINTRTWAKLIAYAMNTSDGEGGFGYRQGSAASGSMSSAGLTVLVIALRELGDGRGLPTAKRRAARRAVDEGLEWFAKDFPRETNPGSGHQRWHPYCLYGIERICAIENIEQIGEHPWYWEGASWFCAYQNIDGSWASGGDRYFQSSFALLFLSRATKSLTGGKTHKREDVWVTTEDGAAVRVRATGDTPMTIWIDGFGEELLAEHAGVRVAKVEYLADGELLQEVEAGVEEKWQGEKFAIRHRFARSREYGLVARVHFVSGRETDPGAIQLGVVESSILRVRVDEIPEPWMIEAAGAERFNHLPAEGVEATATSVHTKGQQAPKAIDGHENTAWYCAADDAEPRLTLAWRRGVRVNRVVITQVPPDPLDMGKADYAQEISLRLNRTAERFVAQAQEDRRAPTVIDLGKDVRVKHVEIYLLKRISGTHWKGRAGINEVQLLYVEEDGTLREVRRR